MNAELSELLGKHPAIERLRKLLSHVAGSRIPIVIEGETGTGKTMLAEILHRLSDRKNGTFMHLDCGGMVEELVANELFGHMRGSYTGADRTQPGLLERAHGGTLFLDELGNLSMDAQTKLLQVLDKHRFRKVGGTEEVAVDVRVVAATSLPLCQVIQEGRFRQDLYYRLKGITLWLPPLRERREDILLLFNHYLTRFCRELDRKTPRLTQESRELLNNYPWPGNVRELMRTAEQIANLHWVEYLTATDLQHFDIHAIRCWELKQCKVTECPAHQAADYRCWLSEHTLCGDSVPRPLQERIHYCLHCEVFVRNCVALGKSDDGEWTTFLQEQINSWCKARKEQSNPGAWQPIWKNSFKEYRQQILHQAVREYFALLLRKHQGDLDSICHHSGLKKSSVYQLLREHDLNLEDFREEAGSYYH